jgi:hypothetical protein
MNREQKETLDALQNDWGLQAAEFISEDEIIQKLADRVILFLEKGPDTFFQLMYRLDIAENKLNTVLNDHNAPFEIAKLIYERQLQKIKSRAANKQNGSEEDSELRW